MKKLKLEDLKVQSFVTAGASRMLTIKGGTGTDSNAGCDTIETTGCNSEQNCTDTGSNSGGGGTGYVSITKGKSKPPLG